MVRYSSIVGPDGLCHSQRLDADELRVDGGVAVLEHEGDDFLQVALKLVERLALAVRGGESGDIPDIQPGGGISSDEGAESPHRSASHR